MFIVTTYEFLFSLQEMFVDRGRSTKQATLKIIMNTTMRGRTPVRDHMICMITFFNEMEILEAKIDDEAKVDMILKTMYDFFNQFKLNYTKYNYKKNNYKNTIYGKSKVRKGKRNGKHFFYVKKGY